MCIIQHEDYKMKLAENNTFLYLEKYILRIFEILIQINLH